MATIHYSFSNPKALLHRTEMSINSEVHLCVLYLEFCSNSMQISGALIYERNGFNNMYDWGEPERAPH